MEEALRAYLSGALAADELEIAYHIGGGLSGETDFRLRGTGEYALWSTVTAGRQRQEYTGQLPDADVRRVVHSALRAHLWEIGHVRAERGLDNPEVRIDVTAGEQQFPVVLWVSEVDDVPRFNDVQQDLLALARRVSDGAVLEVGR